MTPRELPNLTIGDRPTMSPELHRSSAQKGSRWLIACSIALLVAAGITASLAMQPAKTTAVKRAAITRPIDNTPGPELKHGPSANPPSTAKKPLADIPR